MTIQWTELEGRRFDYRGYSYKPDLDDGDPEVRKLSHNIYGPTDKLAGWVHHSPYTWPDRDVIEARIDELIEAGVIEKVIPHIDGAAASVASAERFFQTLMTVE